MCHFSKFVRPGYFRVDATKQPRTNVYLSAYKKGDDIVIVVLNKNTSSQSLTINIAGSKVTTFERYVTTGSKNLSKESNVSGSASLSVTLDAQSMTTFVGKAAAGTPTVTLTAPSNNATFTEPATVNITATATDQDGSISKVEFYNGTTKLGEDASSPYAYAWANVAAGTYSITAVATDNAGNKATSTIASIKVNVPQGPYDNKVHPIPGTIQFEEYDLGGNGVAYNDDSPGSEATPMVAYRSNEDVDIENCTDAGGGYNVGLATVGEWLEYTVNVAAPGSYDLDLRLACNGDGRTISLSMDGAAIGSPISVPNTGGWQTWQTVSVKDLPLKAGQQVLRVTIGSTDHVNMNYMLFKPLLTGLEDMTTAGMELYPNPFSIDGFHIKKAGNFSYRVQSMNGVLVEEGKADDTKKIGQGLMPGIYVLTIENERGRFVQKIMRQ